MVFLENMKVIYPGHFKSFTDDDVKTLVGMWSELLEPYPPAVVDKAFKAYVSAPGGVYAPRPGDLIQIINRLNGRMNYPSADEAWEMVVRAARDANYNAGIRNGELPAMVAKAVGGAARLRQWAHAESGLEFIERDFKARYKEMVSEEEWKIAADPNYVPVWQRPAREKIAEPKRPELPKPETAPPKKGFMEKWEAYKAKKRREEEAAARRAAEQARPAAERNAEFLEKKLMLLEECRRMYPGAWERMEKTDGTNETTAE